MEQLRAAPRDATAYNYPSHYDGAHSAGKRHILGADGLSACRHQLLVDEIAQPADTVDMVLRCRRNGCKDRWPR
jgi:hypothetical protein